MSVFNILSIHTLSNPSLEPLDSAEMNDDLSQRNKRKYRHYGDSILVLANKWLTGYKCFFLCSFTIFFNLLFSWCADATRDNGADWSVCVDCEGIFFFWILAKLCNKMGSYLPYFFIVIPDPPYRCYVCRISIL